MSESEQTVQVGDVRNVGGQWQTVHAIEGDRAVICRDGESDTDGFVHAGTANCCFHTLEALGRYRLISRNGVPVSPAPDRTGPPGYAPCTRLCGRWYAQTMGCFPWCNHCHVKDMGGVLASLEEDLGPDWAPPIAKAEPAKHVERRPCDPLCGLPYVDVRVPMGGVMVDGSPVVANIAKILKFDSPAYCHSDAPAEPAKACVCDGQTKCALHYAGRDTKPAPVVEAKRTPPTGPNWLDCQSCHKRSAGVVLRDTRKGRAGLCEPCMNAEETAICMSMMFESSGAPYKGPERLPRPKLAHAAGLHDDDLLAGEGCAR